MLCLSLAIGKVNFSGVLHDIARNLTQRRRRRKQGLHSKTQVHVICRVKELFQVVRKIKRELTV